MNIIKMNDDKESIKLIEEFLANPKRRYIFGSNDYAKSVYEALEGKIEGFINDNLANSLFCNTKVLKLSSVPKDAIVLSCVVLSQGLNIKERLDKEGFRNITYFAFYKQAMLDIKKIEFVNTASNGLPYTLEHAKMHIESNMPLYSKMYECLADEISKEHFTKVLNFRLNCDIRALKGLRYTPKEQYFEDFLPYHKIDYFLDIGAFEGESSLEFIKHKRDYKQIFCFEPEGENFKKLEQNLSSFRDISYFKLGLGNKEKSLYISTNKGSANKISNTHGEKIEIKRLDSINLGLDSTANGGGLC